MTKTRIVYPLLVVCLFQPALCIAAEKDSGSFFGRTRKAQIEKKAAELDEVIFQSAPDPADEPKKTEGEESVSPVLPKPPVDPNNGIQGINLPPKAPQDITQLPPSMPGTPDIIMPQIETTMNGPITTPAVPIAIQIQAQQSFRAPIAQDSTEAPENTDMEASKSPMMPKTPAEPKSITPVRDRSAIPVTPKLTKTDTRTTNTPNNPPKTPVIPKTK